MVFKPLAMPNAPSGPDTGGPLTLELGLTRFRSNVKVCGEGGFDSERLLFGDMRELGDDDDGFELELVSADGALCNVDKAVRGGPRSGEEPVLVDTGRLSRWGFELSLSERLVDGPDADADGGAGGAGEFLAEIDAFFAYDALRAVSGAVGFIGCPTTCMCVMELAAGEMKS